MSEIEKVKMPWWQKAYCLGFALQSLYVLFTIVMACVPIFGRPVLTWIPGLRLKALQILISFFFSFLFNAFFFFVLLRHWRRDEPL
jgi:ABC-type multidrug transport system permease subunit